MHSVLITSTFADQKQTFLISVDITTIPWHWTKWKFDSTFKWFKWIGRQLTKHVEINKNTHNTFTAALNDILHPLQATQSSLNSEIVANMLCNNHLPWPTSGCRAVPVSLIFQTVKNRVLVDNAIRWQYYTCDESQIRIRRNPALFPKSEICRDT